MVTGASGFIGTHLTNWLALHGYRVRAAVRDMASVWPTQRIDAVQVDDVGPETDWRLALAGVGAVIHLAAHVHRTSAARNKARFRTVNALGSVRLAEEAIRAGVKRFIFLSTIKVNGETTGAQPFNSEDKPAPADAYARSKLQAELSLQELCSTAPMDLVVIRPPLVYGPGAGANFRRLVTLVRSGFPIPLGAVRNRRSLVNVWNLLHLIDTTLQHAAAANRIWLVSDGEDLSTPELIRRIARTIGRPARLPAVPISLVRSMGRVLRRSAEVDRLTESLQVDIASTREHLDWRPIVTVNEALQRTLSPQDAAVRVV